MQQFQVHMDSNRVKKDMLDKGTQTRSDYFNSFFICSPFFIAGFVVPPGHCGHQNILIYLDDTDRISESAHSNNIATTAVYIACETEDTGSFLMLQATHLCY